MIKTDARNILKITSLFLFFLLILGYAFFSSYDLVFGVKIKDINIINGEKITASVINVNGNAKNAVNLILNGREISIDKKGNFNESIALFSGYNIISIEAKDKFGNSDEKDFRLIGEFADEAK